LNNQRRSREGVEHGSLAPLDALGDFDLALAREQRNGAHFAQIHANGVVGLISAGGGQLEIEQILGFFQLGVEFRLFENFDARNIQARENVIQIAAAVEVVRHKLTD